MKRLIFCLIMAISISCGCACAEGGVHLQVIGETDLYEDQQYKLLIRDRAMEYIAMHGLSDAEGLEQHLNSINTDFDRHFPIRVERGIFPCHGGEYDVVRISIGRAEGRNWWGLIYPGPTIPEGDVIYYSAIVNWLMALIGK